MEEKQQFVFEDPIFHCESLCIPVEGTMWRLLDIENHCEEEVLESFKSLDILPSN